MNLVSTTRAGPSSLRPSASPTERKRLARHMAFGVILFLVGVFAISLAGVLLVIEHQIAAATRDEGAFYRLELALLAGGALALLSGALWLARTVQSASK